MALTKNREVDHYVDQELRTLGVGAAKNIFKGALVGQSSAGYAQPLVAGDPFVGIAYEQTDNTAGASGAQSVRIFTVGDFGFALAGATVAHIGRPVFASADDTLTFTGAGNSYLGTVQEVPASGEIVLRIDPQRMRIKTLVHAVEDLSAGADIAAMEQMSAIDGRSFALFGQGVMRQLELLRDELVALEESASELREAFDQLRRHVLAVGGLHQLLDALDEVDVPVLVHLHAGDVETPQHSLT